MKSDRLWRLLFAMLAMLSLFACGGGGGDSNRPRITITAPTSDSSYATTSAGLIVGGTIADANYVHVRSTTTGSTAEGNVTYNAGLGSWFADGIALVPGANVIVVTADADGTGSRTASATITINRPLQPASLVLNGDTSSSTVTYWVDTSSVGGHQLALFGDGTGRSTTGSVLTEAPGPATGIGWAYDGLEAIRITGCPTCSFQRISRISGSLASGGFYAEVETVAGARETALHFFQLTHGSL
ncbi:MAG: hypothetical protein K2X42_04945 [Burkholderiaceae bacterium]|nr:hypothetical protein [Burkholderiaceae bacterium]